MIKMSNQDNERLIELLQLKKLELEEELKVTEVRKIRIGSHILDYDKLIPLINQTLGVLE